MDIKLKTYQINGEVQSKKTKNVEDIYRNRLKIRENRKVMYRIQLKVIYEVHKVDQITSILMKTPK